MAQIKNIDRATVRTLNQKLQEKMREFAEENGLEFEAGNARFNSEEMTTKVTFRVKGEGEEAGLTAQVLLEAYASEQEKKARREAPTDNGIPELDSLCARYNAGKIDISSLVCGIWNASEASSRREAYKKAMRVARDAMCPGDAIRQLMEEEG